MTEEFLRTLDVYATLPLGRPIEFEFAEKVMQHIIKIESKVELNDVLQYKNKAGITPLEMYRKKIVSLVFNQWLENDTDEDLDKYYSLMLPYDNVDLVHIMEINKDKLIEALVNNIREQQEEIIRMKAVDYVNEMIDKMRSKSLVKTETLDLKTETHETQQ